MVACHATQWQWCEWRSVVVSFTLVHMAGRHAGSMVWGGVTVYDGKAKGLFDGKGKPRICLV